MLIMESIFAGTVRKQSDRCRATWLDSVWPVATQPVELNSSNCGLLQEVPGKDESQLVDLVNTPAKLPVLPPAYSGLHLVEVSPSSRSLIIASSVGLASKLSPPQFAFCLLPLFTLCDVRKEFRS